MKLTSEQREKIRDILWEYGDSESSLTKDYIDQIEAIVYPENEPQTKEE